LWAGPLNTSPRWLHRRFFFLSYKPVGPLGSMVLKHHAISLCPSAKGTCWWSSRALGKKEAALNTSSDAGVKENEDIVSEWVTGVSEWVSEWVKES
jgi:hypothetical protein